MSKNRGSLAIKMFFLLLIALSNACKNHHEEKTETPTKGVTIQHATSGVDRSIFLVNTIKKNPGILTSSARLILQDMNEIKDSSSPNHYGLCFWSIEYRQKSGGLGVENVLGELCKRSEESRSQFYGKSQSSPNDNEITINRVNRYIIEFQQLLYNANFLNAKYVKKFWGDTQFWSANRQLGCSIVIPVSTFAGVAVGGLITLPVMGTGSAPGAAVGAAVGESICEYFSTATLQRYDRMSGDITLGGLQVVDQLERTLTYLSNLNLDPNARCDSFLCEPNLILKFTANSNSINSAFPENLAAKSNFPVIQRWFETIYLSESLVDLHNLDNFIEESSFWGAPKQIVNDLLKYEKIGTQENQSLNNLLLLSLRSVAERSLQESNYLRMVFIDPNTQLPQRPFDRDALDQSFSFNDYIKMLNEVSLECPENLPFEQLCPQ